MLQAQLKFKIITRRDGEVVSIVSLYSTYDDEIIQFHQEVFKWSKSIYEESLVELQSLKRKLKEMGYKKVVTSAFYTASGKDKLLKYWEMMGLTSHSVREVDGIKFICSEMEL